ncbi:MAG: hypothetical protein ABR510_03510 [Trueperaceae bacterium]
MRRVVATPIRLPAAVCASVGHAQMTGAWNARSEFGLLALGR